MNEFLMKLLEEVKNGTCVLTAVELHKDIPTIHNFYPKKYYPSINHLGYGCFDGRTEHGVFSFYAGGAMLRVKEMAWTPLSVSKEVLNDLGYDIEKVKKALTELIEGK